MPAAQLDKQLCFALYSASNHVTGIYRPLLEQLGLTYTQLVVLMALWQHDDISITQLAHRAHLSKATMTPLLKRLEEKKLIERQIPPNNERQKRITLTKAGKALSMQSEAITKKVFCATGLSEAQATEMIALCKKITGQP